MKAMKRVYVEGKLCAQIRPIVVVRKSPPKREKIVVIYPMTMRPSFRMA